MRGCRSAISSVFLACLLVAACGQPSPSAPVDAAFSIEVIVRTADNFQTESDVVDFVEMAARTHVAVISLLVKQDVDDDIPSGLAFHRSGIAPTAPGYTDFDVLQSMLDKAHARGIKVRAWLPQFHDQAAVRSHPEWQMMKLEDGRVVPFTGSDDTEFFANPLHPEVQAYELSLINEVAENYPVDGIMLDWLRFDDYNMDVGDLTRREYESASGIDPITIDFSRPGDARDQWNDFRTSGIADYVRTVREALPSDVALGAYILPPDFVEVGQDAGKFAGDVDFLSPMCYFRDWGYPLEWVWENCLATTVRKAGNSGVVPTLDADLTDGDTRQILSHIRQDYPDINLLAWFYAGRWSEDMLERIAQLSGW